MRKSELFFLSTNKLFIKVGHILNHKKGLTNTHWNKMIKIQCNYKPKTAYIHTHAYMETQNLLGFNLWVKEEVI